MNNKFLKKLALGLALVVTVTSVSVPAAKASEAPAFNKAKVNVKVGQTKKLKVKNTEWKLKKAVSSDTNVATAKVKAKKQLVKVTGVSTGKAVVTATFKNAGTKQTVEVPVTVKDNVVTKAAKDYFANYTDRKKQVADVTKLIDENANILIIDIRDAASYEAGHLKGAVNIPYAKIAENLELIPDDIPVYLNCFSGQTASQTVALLAVAGKDAYNIQGGWNNSISKAEGIEAYIETTVNTLSGKTYPVNADIKAAITKYYTDAAASEGGNFNFAVSKLADLIKAGDDTYRVVDIRSAEDHANGHIPGADINVPFPSAMPAGFDNIPKDKPVIVQCYSGQTASQTVAILRLLGYEAYNLSGGMGAEGGSGWLGGGNAVVTETVVTKAAKDYFANYTDRKKQVADVTKLIDENAKILIIDIRDAASYEAGHLKGAVNIPYAKIAENLELIPDDIPVYLNCFSGQTASQTVALLAVAGKDAYNIQGGWNNSISKAEGIEAYIETTVNTLSGKTYPVNADIKAAITKYYTDAAASEGGNFNFAVSKLADLIKAGDDTYRVVDIRSAEDHANGHIPGADINVPFPSAMPAGFDNIPKDKPVIVQCYSGQTASQTVAILRLLGYEAYNLSGGMGAEGGSGWLGGGNAVVK